MGATRIGKTFKTKMIFQILIRIHDVDNTMDPLKPKGLIVAYTCKFAYKVGRTTIHFSFLMPFNKS